MELCCVCKLRTTPIIYTIYFDNNLHIDTHWPNARHSLRHRIRKMVCWCNMYLAVYMVMRWVRSQEDVWNYKLHTMHSAKKYWKTAKLYNVLQKFLWSHRCDWDPNITLNLPQKKWGILVNTQQYIEITIVPFIVTS